MRKVTKSITLDTTRKKVIHHHKKLQNEKGGGNPHTNIKKKDGSI